jgi:peptidoglycan/LPS O-acetylase OafA/YrhL
MLIGNASYSIYLVHFYFKVIAAKGKMRRVAE